MRYSLSFLFSLLLLPQVSLAAFPDVPAGTPLAEATSYLKEHGILKGYADGSFRAHNPVNRAEAIKIIIAHSADESELTATTTVYGDIGAGEWYLPYVEYARAQGVIDGPPKKTNFHGINPVITPEFIKMLTLASNVDSPNVTADMILPLSYDVTDSNEWYFPYMRYGLVSSMIRIHADGSLQPGKQLTRGDAALMLYYFLLFQENKRSQALLSQSETEMVATMKFLESGDMDDALRSCARAMLAARGSLAQHPENSLLQGAAKMAGGIYFLVQTNQAMVDKDYDGAISRAKDVWQRAEEGKALSGQLAPLAGQMQRIAKEIADAARGMGGRG